MMDLNKYILEIDAGMKSMLTAKMANFGYKVSASRIRAYINIIDQILHATCSKVLPTAAARASAALHVDNAAISFELVFKGVVDDVKLPNDWRARRQMEAQLIAYVSFDGNQPKACQVGQVIVEVVVPYSSFIHYDHHKGKDRAVYNELFIKLALLRRLFFKNFSSLNTKSKDDTTNLTVRASRELASSASSLLVKKMLQYS